MPTSRSNRPNVVITIGDPAGVGPEVTVKALASPRISRLANFLVIGDALVIKRVEKLTGLKLKHSLIDLANVPVKKFAYGRPNPLFGKASIEYIDKALELLKAKRADALVTAPVNKASINSSFKRRTTDDGRRTTIFEGHTEYLAQHTRTKDFAMMFVAKRMKIVLVTRHIALKDVPRSISKEAIYRAISLAHKNLKEYFGIENPKIGVAGLNPHAGESGLFGDEEDSVIIPAIRKASRRMDGVSGPVPPDVIFSQVLSERFDAAVALYHDQALIPFKLLYFKDGVNMTLGLPFIRTSPDHGTAFDIAGKGVADPTSMIEAIKLACRLAQKKIICSTEIS